MTTGCDYTVSADNGKDYDAYFHCGNTRDFCISSQSSTLYVSGFPGEENRTLSVATGS